MENVFENMYSNILDFFLPIHMVTTIIVYRIDFFFSTSKKASTNIFVGKKLHHQTLHLSKYSAPCHRPIYIYILCPYRTFNDNTTYINGLRSMCALRHILFVVPFGCWLYIIHVANYPLLVFPIFYIILFAFQPPQVTQCAKRYPHHPQNGDILRNIAHFLFRCHLSWQDGMSLDCAMRAQRLMWAISCDVRRTYIDI